ncbi:MAG: hypothetical protein KG003_04950 [Bacteroidetes bacterium]|nr:hypothetical protein [Bacteroidota bacterium]
MEKIQFEISDSDKKILSEYRDVILKQDKNVRLSTGSVMGAQHGFAFTEEGVFKYGIVKNKDYFSFHSMVIYSSPAMMEDLKSRMKGTKFQKGCANFKSPESFPIHEFDAHMKASAKADFSIVIQHYKKKN